MKLLYVCVIIVTALHPVYSLKRCRNELDYYIPFSENCWDSPSHDTIIGVVKNLFGFYTEQHFVITKDGYTISLVRFYWIVTKKNPVILGHGTFSNGFSYVAQMENSLAYILGTEGYDVWIINFRGTKYSRKHKKSNVDEDMFWNFSFHEMGVFDLPAITDYIYKITNAKSLYVGMSMGTSALLVYASVKSSEAMEKLLGAVLMAPAGKFTNQNSTLLQVDPTTSFIPHLIPQYHHGAVGYDGTIRTMFIKLAASSPIFSRGVYSMMALLDGNHPEKVDWNIYPIATHSLDITTDKILMHYGQCIRTGEFKYFDYGEENNMKKYNKKKPSLYPLQNIKVPIAVIVTEGDLITPIGGAVKLYDELPTEAKCGLLEVKDPALSHIGIFTSECARKEVYKPTLEYLRKMEHKTCQP